MKEGSEVTEDEGVNFVYDTVGPILGSVTDPDELGKPVYLSSDFERIGSGTKQDATQMETAPEGEEGLSDFGEDEFIPLGAGSPEQETAQPAEVLAEQEEGEIGPPPASEAELSGLSSAPPPWALVTGPWARLKSPLLRLHQEIVNFCAFVAPSEAEQRERREAVERVSQVVLSVWPLCVVKVFGSYATGLYLPTSDVDMVVLGATCSSPQQGLKALSVALTRKGIAKKMQVIGKARVPIIKFVEANSNICFDISFDVSNGPDAASFIQAAMEELPALKPLCMVLKIFLQQRELNEVYTGGVGSYALLTMLMAHLQLHPSWRRDMQTGERGDLEGNLGILLVDFLELYGRSLNVYDVGVSCRNGGAFYAKRLHRPPMVDDRRPYLLSVEDPQAVDNDLGKNSYNISKVRSAFMHAHRLLTSRHVEGVAAAVGLLGRVVRMDAALVDRPMPVLAGIAAAASAEGGPRGTPRGRGEDGRGQRREHWQANEDAEKGGEEEEEGVVVVVPGGGRRGSGRSPGQGQSMQAPARRRPGPAEGAEGRGPGEERRRRSGQEHRGNGAAQPYGAEVGAAYEARGVKRWGDGGVDGDGRGKRHHHPSMDGSSQRNAHPHRVVPPRNSREPRPWR